MMIRYALVADIPAVQGIARQHSKMLGFVRRASLERAIDKRELFVANLDGKIAGFVNWHARRDGWSTIYELATDKACQGQGVGRALLYAVPCPIRLKCTVDNPANRFYVNAGMNLARVEQGKKRALNVYELRVLTALIQGNNRQLAEVARLSGMTYGTRHIDKPIGWPFFLDVEWERFKKNPDEWAKYMALVNQYHPVAAMCVDYEQPEQRETLHKQIADLRAAGVLRVMVCPKFNGAIVDIPADCIVAVSVPSSYAGFLPRFSDLKGRMVHLLGGTPQKQKDIMVKIAGHGGKVISTDGNSHQQASKFGAFYSDGKWRFDPRKMQKLDIYDLCTKSGTNIQRELNATAGYVQLPLIEKTA
jgi:GNAT superfamily N-acetyltransferase